MNLFEKMTNICGIDQNLEIEKAIISTKTKLEKLTEERMCKVYNGLLLNELLLNHIPTRLVNTLDLGIDYEHFFLLIPHNKNVVGGEYILADLTFSQFPFHEQFSKLLEKGYQEVKDNEFNDYLNKIAQKEISFTISLEEAYYKIWEDPK